MLAGLALGAALGVVAHAVWGRAPGLGRAVELFTEPLGALFLRALFMLVIPLIVSGLSLGIAGLGDIRRLGRIGLRTFVFTVASSLVAVLLGVLLVNVFRPGDGLSPEARARLLERAGTSSFAPAGAPRTGLDFLLGLVPSNIVRAMADGDMLAVMVFSLLLGTGLLLTPGRPARQLEEALQGLYDVVMRLLDLVIRTAPFAVACLLFSLTARLGWEVLQQLVAFVLVVLAALAIQLFGVYSLVLAWLGRRRPREFFRAVRAAMITAFSTASSNATLPTSLLVAERELGLPSHVSRFVLTVGSTANQHGTALFEGVTVLFLAQFYGVELPFGQQILVVLICVLGGIGTAGVPAGSLPVVAMILGMVGIPVEGIGMILGVDRFLDMCRTTLNVTGDLVAAVVVARDEPNDPDAVVAPAASEGS
jgi:DAACS family dicarboxylate/amino acid:cation (Na+ or H+) symporter